jgi:predicted O-methyltransferase YrrM
MDDFLQSPPPAFQTIQREAQHIGFTLSSEPQTGALLRTLAASKPGGRLLEIGTGAGAGTCWLLDGMDASATLTSIDRDAHVSGIARRQLGQDTRVTFLIGNAEDFLLQPPAHRYDLIFADSFPGKYVLLDQALDLLAVGGLYVVDDLLPQPTWPEHHQASVDELIERLEARPDLRAVRLDWASGVMICTKISV